MAYFAASCDTLETNTEFARSLELDYPILSDPERKTAEAYGVVDESRRHPARRDDTSHGHARAGCAPRSPR